jgi:UDP-glucose 4-epimerase
LRILVTGGAGFIGSHLTEGLIHRNLEIICLDNFSYGVHKNLETIIDDSNLEVVEGDIRDRTLLSKICKDIEAVIHLAAVVSVEKSFERPWETNEINVTGTIDLLDVCVKNRVRRFIYISSAAVYGLPLRLPVDENHPTNPISPYGASKLAAEQYVRAFSKAYGLETAILRIFNAYGSRQRISQYSGVISIFIEQALKGEQLTIYGDGTQTRDLIYVEDVVDAIMKSIEHEKVTDAVINIASGKPTKIKDLAKTVINLVGKGLEIKYLPDKKGDIKHSYARTEKALELIDFKAKTSLEEGLKKILKGRLHK